MFSSWDEKYRSRKFLLTVWILGAATIGLFTGYISGDNFAQIASVTITSYSFGNAAEYYTKVNRAPAVGG